MYFSLILYYFSAFIVSAQVWPWSYNLVNIRYLLLCLYVHCSKYTFQLPQWVCLYIFFKSQDDPHAILEILSSYSCIEVTESAQSSSAQQWGKHSLSQLSSSAITTQAWMNGCAPGRLWIPKCVFHSFHTSQTFLCTWPCIVAHLCKQVQHSKGPGRRTMFELTEPHRAFPDSNN